MIISYDDKIRIPTDEIRDIHDGIQFKRIRAKYPDFFILSLTVNTDGARIFRNTNKSMWPIQLYQNFLHPSVRYIPENIIVSAIHQGKLFCRNF